MSIPDLLNTVRSYVIGASPGLVFWAVVLVFGIVISRRDRSGAGGYLVAGAGLKLGAALLGIALSTLRFRDVVVSAANPSRHATWWTAGDIIINVIGAAGILLLLYAFWMKARPAGAAEEWPAE
jgi:hypothetical protein